MAALELTNPPNSSRNKPHLGPKQSKSPRLNLSPGYSHVAQDSADENNSNPSIFEIDTRTPEMMTVSTSRCSMDSDSPPARPRSLDCCTGCCGAMLLGWYGFVAVAVLAMLVYGWFFSSNHKQLMLICTLSLISISTVVSIIALIRLGTFNDHLRDLSIENEGYRNQINELKQNTKAIQDTNDGIESENKKLNVDLSALEQQTQQFSGLVDALQVIADETGMEFTHLLDQTNARFEGMETLIYLNHKTYFLTLFYKIGGPLDEAMYQKLKYRMFPKFREKFERLGPFHANCGEDGEHIDVARFEEMVEEVLQDPKAVLQDEFIRQYTRGNNDVKGIEYMTEKDRKQLLREVEQET